MKWSLARIETSKAQSYYGTLCTCPEKQWGLTRWLKALGGGCDKCAPAGFVRNADCNLTTPLRLRLAGYGQGRAALVHTPAQPTLQSISRHPALGKGEVASHARAQATSPIMDTSEASWARLDRRDENETRQ